MRAMFIDATISFILKGWQMRAVTFFNKVSIHSFSKKSPSWIAISLSHPPSHSAMEGKSPPEQHTCRLSLLEPREPRAKQIVGSAAVATGNPAVAVSVHQPRATVCTEDEDGHQAGVAAV